MTLLAAYLYCRQWEITDALVDLLIASAAAPLHLRDDLPGLRRDDRDRPCAAVHLPARWPRDRDLQRETASGLNVVENYNGLTTTSGSASAESPPPTAARSSARNAAPAHPPEQPRPGQHLDDPGHVALPEWEGVLTDADRRGLTPIFHANMTPYGEIQLRTDRRLDLAGVPSHGGVSP